MLALVLTLSITPQIVLANSNISDRYEEVSSTKAIVGDAEVHVYVTQNGGTVELTDSNTVETTFPQGIGYREYKAIPADGWIWKGWKYEQLYQGKDLGNRTDGIWKKRYSFSNKGSDWKSAYNGTGQTISVNRLTTAGETIGNKITYNLYANFNPTINATAGEGGTITAKGVTEVEYGGNKTYTITAEAGKEIASVIVDGKAISDAVGKDSFSYNFENVREPHTINVAFIDKLWPPDAPKNSDVEGLLTNAVKIDCVNTAVSHDPVTYPLENDTYSIGTVTKNEADGYTVDVTVNAAKYVEKYNDEKNVTHELKTNENLRR